MRRASEAQRQRLHQTFAELCRIESPSGNERACADWVARELEAIGLAVEEDDAGAAAGANAGNLLVRIPAGAGEAERQPGDEGERQPGDEGERQPPSIMLCSHLDTVPATGPIEPVVVDGGWTNAKPTILGADNKAAVAVLLELARGVVGSAQPQPAGVELVFTVSEENGLHGAKAFDVSQLRSSIGFVFDHASPIGEIVIASPTYHRLEAEFGGRAAHAGLRPEDLIVSVNDTPTASVYDLQRLMVAELIGVEVPVTVVRDGRPLELRLVPEELRE